MGLIGHIVLHDKPKLVDFLRNGVKTNLRALNCVAFRYVKVSRYVKVYNLVSLLSIIW